MMPDAEIVTLCPDDFEVFGGFNEAGDRIWIPGREVMETLNIATEEIQITAYTETGNLMLYRQSGSVLFGATDGFWRRTGI